MKKKLTKTSKELNTLKPKHKKVQTPKAKIKQEPLEELQSFKTKKPQEIKQTRRKKKSQEVTGSQSKSGGADNYIPTGRHSSPKGSKRKPQKISDGTRASTPRKTIIAPELEETDELVQGLYTMSEEEWNEYRQEDHSNHPTEYIPELTATGELLDQLNFYKQEYAGSLSWVQKSKEKLMDDFIFIVNRNSNADKEGYELYLQEHSSEIFDNLTELYNDSKQEEIQTDYTNVSSALNYGDGYYIRD